MGKVTFENINKSYGSVVVVPELNLVIPEGSFTVLVGPSGCGKSTVLRMIAGLEVVTSGKIYIDGDDVTYAEPSRRKIAMVFQSYALYPHMTVAENIGFGLTLAKRPKEEITSRVLDVATILQLDHLLDRTPKDLSGGQRQRVAIGRAITRNPKVFLFDEPLSNLDASLRGQMRVEISDLHAKIGATMVYVTHDQVEAMTMADQIVVLNKGSIEQVGKPMDLYNKPQTQFVAEFIGSPNMNIFNGQVARNHDCETLGVRPEHITISTSDGELEGSVRYKEELGADTILYVDGPENNSVTVRINGSVDLQIGSTIFMNFDPANLHRFNNGNRL